jgi:purine-binding chemotaxis protein CheW
MSSFSSLRSRRFVNRQQTPLQSWVTFVIHSEGFALPIAAVQQVVPLDRIYGDPQRSGLSLTRYRDRELLVVDVGYRIFGNPPALPVIPSSLSTQLLLVVQNARGEIVGVPIESPPSVRHLADSAFVPIPDSYLATGNLHCISAQRITTEANESFFILDAEALLRTEVWMP